MITHNDQIAQLADRIVRIEDGKNYSMKYLSENQKSHLLLCGNIKKIRRNFTRLDYNLLGIS